MENRNILDITKSSDDNFNSILDAVSTALDVALTPFLQLAGVDTPKEFMQFMRYDYDSFYATIVGNLLTSLSMSYDNKLPQKKIVERMSSIDTGEFYDDERNRKRVKRIKKKFNERSNAHATYLHTPEYAPRMLVTHALWYDLISEFPIIKKFLHEDNPIITKNFFDELALVYNEINTHSGYDRFFLLHKLEASSALELFYKLLMLIKKEKRSKKLSDKAVKQMINGIIDLYIFPLNQLELLLELPSYGFKIPKVFQEVAEISPLERTTNSIVFNIDSLIDYYFEQPSIVTDFLHLLNFIHNAVVFHLSTRIENELCSITPENGFEFIDGIKHCFSATTFFDDFLDSKVKINLEKDCSSDITFTQFKLLYNIKTEKQKENNQRTSN